MLLVTGAQGQLGRTLRPLLDGRALFATRDILDITNEVLVHDFCTQNHIDAVINCASYTAVDKAESNQELADSANNRGVEFLARHGRRIIQISTDYVFDGTAHTPYAEEAPTNPLSVYGKTKLAGEKKALECAESAIVIRTAWLYSIYGNNFVHTMRRLGSQKEKIGVVCDQIGSPTCTETLSSAIIALLPRLMDGVKDTLHCTDEGVASWYDFAVAIMRESHLSCKVEPIATYQYPTPAHRPAYSVLDKAKIRRELGFTAPHWTETLTCCIKAM